MAVEWFRDWDIAVLELLWWFLMLNRAGVEGWFLEYICHKLHHKHYSSCYKLHSQQPLCNVMGILGEEAVFAEHHKSELDPDYLDQTRLKECSTIS